MTLCRVLCTLRVGQNETDGDRNALAHAAVKATPCDTSFETPPQCRLNMGRQFMVVLSGDMMTMPGMPKISASDGIDIDADDNVVGLAWRSTETRCPPAGAHRVRLGATRRAFEPCDRIWSANTSNFRDERPAVRETGGLTSALNRDGRRDRHPADHQLSSRAQTEPADSVCIQGKRAEIGPDAGSALHWTSPSRDSLNSEKPFVPTQEIPRTIGGVNLRHGLIALWCLVSVSCAQVTNGPPEDAVQTAEPPETTPLAANEAATPEPPSFAPFADVSDSTQNSIDDPLVATEPEPALPTLSHGDMALEASEQAVVAHEAAAIQEFGPAPGLVPFRVASPISAETLDFSSLVTRLRKTKAISLRTKVAVKNESDHLLEQVRAYHTQNGITTLADLRRSYDLLFHKLHSLLQDADPPLARDIDRSQAAIWELLADPRKFRASDLMAGA